ncbi:hypothetical protein ACH5RR_028065 [Cinchona calisaya]|uniref:E3 ubiquitin-protein ligase RMA n=1 Tax=Cinchona calisaya TaxID=153742 RepID=A0ABD2YMP5_9GENT
MDSEQHFSEPSIGFPFEEDDSVKQKSNSVPASTVASENLNGGFDCNICLDSAHEPVVTLCGHLYCWPCIYKWLHVQSSSTDSDERPKCPVCKTNISNSLLIPLYGRGASAPESEARKRQLDLAIPHRPPAIGTNAPPSNVPAIGSHPHQQLHANLFHPQPDPFQQQQDFQPQLQSLHHQPYFPHPFGGFASMGPSGFGHTATTSSYSPTIVMFGEMVFPGMFGSSGTSMFASAHPATGYGSPRRMRRQELPVEKSLGRVLCFLVCCSVLCLLLF